MTTPAPLRPDSASRGDLRVRQDPQRSDVLWGAGGLLLALSITVVAWVFHARERQRGETAGDALGLATLFSALSVVAAVYTVWSWRKRRRTRREFELREGEIVCSSSRGPIWSEPISSYSRLCVFDKTVTRMARHGTTTSVFTALRLEHPSRERSFEISSDLTPGEKTPIPELCRRWAEATELPVWDEDQGVERSHAAVQRPLQGLVSGARGAGAPPSLEALPRGVTRGADDDGPWVRAKLSLFFLCMVPLALLGAMSTSFQSGEFLGIHGGAVSFAIIAAALALLPFVVGYELRAHASGVSTALRVLGVRMFRRQFAAADIQRVFSGAAGLVIESSERRLTMPGTGRRAADWVARWVVEQLGALR